MNQAAKLEKFERWFATQGHWIYQSRAEAMTQWMEFGIDGLPKFSA